MNGDEDLGQDIIMKGDKFHYNQKLNQFATGMNGDEDLGQDIIMKGDKFHYNQRMNQFATGMNGDEDLGQDIIMKGDKFHYNQKLNQFATGMNGDEDLGQDIIMKGDKFHYNQKLAQKRDVQTTKTINETGVDESVYHFTAPLVETLDWNRNKEAYAANGGDKGGWGSVANSKPALSQRQDIANKEVRPDVYVTVRNMISPHANWRSAKPPTVGNFEPYKGAVEVPDFAKSDWKEPKKDEEA